MVDEQLTLFDLAYEPIGSYEESASRETEREEPGCFRGPYRPEDAAGIVGLSFGKHKRIIQRLYESGFDQFKSNLYRLARTARVCPQGDEVEYIDARVRAFWAQSGVSLE